MLVGCSFRISRNRPLHRWIKFDLTLLQPKVNAIVQFIENQKYVNTYLIITRSQKAAVQLFSGLLTRSTIRLEGALLDLESLS